VRSTAVALAAASLFATAIQAQQPTVSPALARGAIRDSTITIWLMAQPGQDLSDVEGLVRQLGGRLRRRSNWLHAISAELDRTTFNNVRTSPLLRHIQPVARFVGPARSEGVQVSTLARAAGHSADDSVFGSSAMPLRQLNLFPIVNHGIRGAGVRIAIFDTGFETEHPAFAGVSVVAQHDFVFGDSVVRNEAGDISHASRHGTEVWSLLAAGLPTQIVGIAPEAEYVLAKTEDVRSETRVEEDNYVAALEWADSIGVDIVTSSLSYMQFDDGFSYTFNDLNGDVAVTTIAADSAVARGIVVVTAAGNDGASGFRSLSTPADGDSVIAVGAEDSLGVLSGFSSRGPTADGRLKPDLTAPGQSVFVVDPTVLSGFSRVNGTSFSTPIIAGTIALIRELHPFIAPMEIIEALKNSGTHRETPDSSYGWGRPDATVAATFARGLQLASPVDSNLTTITPLFSWQIPELPSFAEPMTYRLRVAEDTTFGTIILDTTVTHTEVQLESPMAPGQSFVFDLTATSADSASLVYESSNSYVVPEWLTLLTLSTPAGTTIRERRPTFRWTGAEVSSPPGPFLYDVSILRVDNGVATIQTKDLSETTYVPPRDLDLNTPYRWSVLAWLGTDSIVAESEGSFVIVDESMPTATLLFQNFPNPFPNVAAGVVSTCIWFDLAEDDDAKLDILDIRGHIVKSLVPANVFPTTVPAGRYGRGSFGDTGRCDPRLEWDGTATDGSVVPRGIYPVRLKTAQGTFFKRVVFLGRDP
jgi:subtilisin family serine protease